jgi:hypothetical protein
LAALQLDHIVAKDIFGVIGHVARGAQVAFGSIIGPLTEIITLHGLRDEEMQVGIALAMGMRYHVYRDTVDGDVDIGAMVGVETPQEDLFGLTASLMLRYE